MLQQLLDILNNLALGQRDLEQLYQAIERTVAQDRESIARAQALIDASRALLRNTKHLVETRWW